MQVEVILFEANQTATATQLEFDAKIQAVAFEIGAETEAYDQLQQKLDFSDDEVLAFPSRPMRLFYLNFTPCSLCSPPFL